MALNLASIRRGANPLIHNKLSCSPVFTATRQISVASDQRPMAEHCAWTCDTLRTINKAILASDFRLLACPIGHAHMC